MSRQALVFDIETIGDITDRNRDAVASFAQRADRTPEHFAALCPPLARVVCIAAYDLADDSLFCLFDGSLGGQDAPLELGIPETGRPEAHPCRMERAQDEADLLRRFATRLDRHFETPGAVLVSFNGAGFDLPVLVHRSVHHGIQSLRERLTPDTPARHIDLMEEFTFRGATRRQSLALYAMALGFDSPKQQMDGAGVGPAVSQGRISDVAAYCAADVIATTELYRRWFGLPSAAE